MKAVILAGGKGRRLRPYTTVLPKPLMPIGERPILEIIIEQLKMSGCREITMAVGHLAGLIQAYFGDGDKYGMKIEYSLEHEPLGTAGPIGILDRPDENFVVMNGDILTDLDYRDFYERHRSSDAIATMAVFHRHVDITLGVVEMDEGGTITDYTEKPRYDYLVSTGIYCFSPRVMDFIRPNEHCDLPDLVLQLIGKGEKVQGYRFDGYWLDIGRQEDYETAILEYSKGRF